MRSVQLKPTIGTWVPQVHKVCPHNEIESLCSRTLGPLPWSPNDTKRALSKPVKTVFNQLRRFVRRCYHEDRWSLLHTAHSYSGLLQKRYLEACSSLNSEPLSPADAELSCFLKAEKVNPLAKFQKPRMIYPRSARYNLSLASRLKPFEHWLWGRMTNRPWGGDGSRVVAKGLNQRQRANLIVRKMNNFRNCEVFEVDGKAFEAHVLPIHLSAEHSIYHAAYPGDKGLRGLLCNQRQLKGRLACGAKFFREGGRASGDFNTGMGNTLIMYGICVGVLTTFRVKFDVLVDGDNALVFLEASESGPVLQNFARCVLDSSGMEFVLERPVRIIEEVRFGRSAPVFLGGNLGYTMVREVESVLSGGMSSHRFLREPAFAREWLTGVAMCELSLAIGIPMLQAWALMILRGLEFRKRVRCWPYQDYFIQGARFADAEEQKPISHAVRVSFCAAFGWSPEQQIIFEQKCGKTIFRPSILHIDGVFDTSSSPALVQVPPFSDLQGCIPGVGEDWLDAQ